MIRPLSLLAVSCLLAGVASAQCLNPNYGTLAPTAAGTPGYGDDFLFDVVPLNFAFPLGGGVATTYTHAQVCTNGFVYLTNGAPSGDSDYGYPTDADFFGAATRPPRIAPLWVDLESIPANGGGVYVNNTIPGVFVVTWSNVWEWNTTNPIFTVQAQIFANGDVVFSYSGNTGVSVNQEVVTGISQGNGIAATPSVDLSAGGNTAATNAIFERQAPGVCDLGGLSLTFTKQGGGYLQTTGSCNPAFNQTYGVGCYAISDSFYQFFADALPAPSLNGQSMSYTLAGTDYLVQWGGGTYVPPTGAAVALAVGDDNEVSQAPSIAFPAAGGAWPVLYISGNGMISASSNLGIQPFTYRPTPAGFLDAPGTAFFSWHDFNAGEGGSVKYEEAVVSGETIAYITWDAVESYPTGTVNPSTMQFQLNLNTGTVTIVWVTMDGNNTSPFGSAHLIGYSTAGPSIDSGSITIAGATPFVTSSSNASPMSLTASPAPISSLVSGTNVVYTTNNIPEFAPGAGSYLGAMIFSLGQLPGIDLGFLGAPGCSVYVASLDFTLGLVSVTPSATGTLALPPGVPAGTQVFAQSIALITPGSLPNGQNAFGLLTSNGVQSYISTF